MTCGKECASPEVLSALGAGMEAVQRLLGIIHCPCCLFFLATVFF